MITGYLVQALKDDATVAAMGAPPLAARIYPVNLPDAPTYPAVCISKITGGQESWLAGPSNAENSRIQIDVYDLNYNACVLLAHAIRAAMIARPVLGPACVIDSVHCIQDTDFPAGAPLAATERAGPPKLRRRLMEFRVWYRPQGA